MEHAHTQWCCIERLWSGDQWSAGSSLLIPLKQTVKERGVDLCSPALGSQLSVPCPVGCAAGRGSTPGWWCIGPHVCVTLWFLWYYVMYLEAIEWNMYMEKLFSERFILNFLLFLNFFGCAMQHVASWFSDQGSNPCPLAVEAWSLTTGLQGKFLEICFEYNHL